MACVQRLLKKSQQCSCFLWCLLLSQQLWTMQTHLFRSAVTGDDWHLWLLYNTLSHRLLGRAASSLLTAEVLLTEPGKSDEEWGRDCSKDYWAGILDRIVVLHLIFFFYLLAGGGGSFFIDSDNGQSKWFSHSNLPKNHRRDFLPYLKYDFCYY